MKARIYLTSIVFAMGVIPAAAQNLDPTVNVTRTYEGKLLEVDKPSLRMTVPDSVTRFNLDFDYSVIQNQYKGGSKFDPYLQDIRPEQAAEKDARLWLRLGAGYNFHPEFDLVWAAVRRERFSMNVYADHRSYLGRYRGVENISKTNRKGEAVNVLSTQKYLAPSDGSEPRFKGYDIYNRAGLNGRYDWLNGYAKFDVNYTGYASKDTTLRRAYNSMNVSARAKSNNNDSDYFFYDAGVAYSFGQHDFVNMAATAPYGYFREHLFNADASLGPVLSYYHSILADVNLKVASYDAASDSGFKHAGLVSLTPKYVYAKDRWNISAGVKVEFLLRPKDSEQNQNKGQVVYPKVNVNFEAVRDYLNIYFRADGGADINSYSKLLSDDHWFNPLYASGTAPLDNKILLDNTIERVDVSLGVNGNISHRFAYDLRAGYANYERAAVRTVFETPLGLAPGIAYSDMHSAYVSMAYGVKTNCVDVDGSLTWRYSDFIKTGDDEHTLGFLPSALTGDVSVTYNWRHRIFAGVSLDGSLARDGYAILGGSREYVKLPGYLDLGLNFEYLVTKKFSVWAKAGNLACMTIQKTPLYAEAGPYFTVGICLNL